MITDFDAVGWLAPGAALMLCLGLFLDWLVGDMRWFFKIVPHPVVIVGNLIGFLDRKLNRTGRSAANRKVRGFSGGMKVKMALALALAHRPDLLVLDEPTAGLDPVARREFLEMVRDQATQSGRTTLFSTHLVDEIEAAADRIGIVDGGRLRFEGRREDLVEGIRRLRHPWRPGEEAPALPPSLVTPYGQAPAYRLLQNRARDGEWQLVVEAAPELLAGLEAAPGPWRVERLPLEEAFIEMVRKPVDLGAASPGWAPNASPAAGWVPAG